MEDFHAQATSQRAKRVVIAIVSVFVIGLIATSFVLYLSKREARRNAERLKDVQAITTALHQYAALHDGASPPGLESREKQIGSATTGCEVSTAQCSISATDGCLDLAPALKPFLKDLPTDPGSGSAALTRYAVRAERGGGFLVTACDYSE